MSNPTTPFSWQMPTATDLVTDLPADFEVFGQAVATSMADLLGGTSGQILAKNSNTDMDFVWIANDQGDITGITASSPLTGGGTSGAVTIGILNGTTSNLGAVQLSDSTSSTSTTLAATANAVKTTYDLANGAIPKSLIDAAGDLIVGTAADTAGRLGIGTAGQVLKVNSGATALEWGTASGSGKVLQVVSATTTTSTSFSSASYADTTITATITPTSATSKILVLVTATVRLNNAGTTVISNNANAKIVRGATDVYLMDNDQFLSLYLDGVAEVALRHTFAFNYLDSPATTSATTYKVQANNSLGSGSSSALVFQQNSNTSQIILMEIGA